MVRAERALTQARQRPEDQDLYLDSAALNLHDFYTGLERIFHQIAAMVDGSMSTAREWHRDLLRQMSTDLPHTRPPVLSAETTKMLDEYLSFRHVVRNIYAFEFDWERIERLIRRLRPAYEQVETELLSFADFLERVGGKEP